MQCSGRGSDCGVIRERVSEVVRFWYIWDEGFCPWGNLAIFLFRHVRGVRLASAVASAHIFTWGGIDGAISFALLCIGLINVYLC